MAAGVTWSALCFRLQPFISGQAAKKLAVEKVSSPAFVHLANVRVLPPLAPLTDELARLI